MKTNPVPAPRPAPFPEDRRHHAMYRDAAPAVCGSCHAVFQHGYWAWAPAPAGAAVVLCPACERVRGRQPAGYVVLDGALTRGERAALTPLLREIEQQECSAHALERIMDITGDTEQVQVTTTGAHLAQRLAVALERRFGGQATYSFNDQAHVLRVRWERR